VYLLATAHVLDRHEADHFANPLGRADDWRTNNSPTRYEIDVSLQFEIETWVFKSQFNDAAAALDLCLISLVEHVPAKEARGLCNRPAVVEFVLEVADIGLGPRLT
jgi:hypothetical protein